MKVRERLLSIRGLATGKIKEPQKNNEEKVNKSELVEEVANQTGLAKKTSSEAVNAIISVMTAPRLQKKESPWLALGLFR